MDTNFKLRTRKQDDNYVWYILKKDKNNNKKWYKDDGLIFVFYTLEKSANWEYKKAFPKTWHWSGSGHTNSFIPGKGMSNKYKYLQEEQFNGSLENRDKMKEYLVKYFEKLKKDKIIKYYKIKYSYKPE